MFHAVNMKHNKHHPESFETQPDFFSNSAPFFAVSASRNGLSSRNEAPRDPHRIQISSPAEVLAYIQCTLGFEPTNSLAAVAFANNKMSTVVRCDLPEALQHMLRSDTPESVTFMDFGMTETQELQFIDIGRHIGELMAREPSTSSCLLIYLADDVTVSDQHALAVLGTANAVITAQFGVQGVPVNESWLMHHHTLWHLRCAATTDCVVQGEAVDDPKATKIFQTLDPLGSTAAKHKSEARRLLFPPASTGTPRREIDTPALLEYRPQVVLNWLTLWDKQLREGPAMMHSHELAELLSALEHPRIRDAILATACFDVPTAIRGMVALGQFPGQLATLANLHNSLSDGITVKDCLKGQSERVPNWTRISELERLCHQLLPLSDAHSGGVVAGLLVWIEWVRGRGSIALSYGRQARKHFPTEQFLGVLEGFLRQGTVAGWATRTETAWTPQHAA